MYEYKIANIAKVIDGDTFDFDLDLGFHVCIRIRIRLANIDTWEIYGKNAHELGPKAKDFAYKWLQNATDLRVKTSKFNSNSPTGDGSFGRWAGEVFDAANNTLLEDALRLEGFEKNT